MTVVLFLPDTVLLVPGAAGADGDPLADARVVAVAALRSALASLSPTAPILVLARGEAGWVSGGPVRSGVGAFGLPISLARGRGSLLNPQAASLAGPRVSVGAALLELADVTGPERVTLAEIEPEQDPEALNTLTARIGDEDSIVVAMGSGSARHGPQGPLPDDPRAPGVNDLLFAAFGSGPDALSTVLAEIVPLAAELAITGARIWQLVLRLLPVATQEQIAADVLWSGTPGGAFHTVARWRIERGVA